MKMKDKILNKLWNNEEFSSDDYHCFRTVIIVLQQYKKLGTIEELKAMLSMTDAKFIKMSYYSAGLLDNRLLDVNLKLQYSNLNKNAKALLNTMINSHSFSNKEIKYVNKKIKKLRKYTKLGVPYELRYIMLYIKDGGLYKDERSNKNRVK